MYILTFDEDSPFVDGLPVRTLCPFFLTWTGVAIALMIPAQQELLVSTIIWSSAIVLLRVWGKTLNRLCCFSAFGFLGMVAGLYISYYAETPASVRVLLLFVTLSLLISV